MCDNKELNEWVPVSSSLSFSGGPEEVAAMLSALARAKGKFDAALKSSSGQAGTAKFRYADMGSLLDATEPALCAEGLVVMQPPNGNSVAGATITTILAGHGGMLISSVTIPGFAVQDIKLLGAYITYIRRYCYQALLGIAGEDDADNHGEIRGPGSPRQAPSVTAAKAPADGPMSEATRKAISNEAQRISYNKAKVLAVFEGQGFPTIGHTESQAQSVLTILRGIDG